MKNPEKINFSDVLLENVNMEIPIRNLLSTPTMTHNRGSPKDMIIKSNRNASHIEKIEKYNEITLQRLKQNIVKVVLKQYPPTSNNMPACNVTSSIKEHIGSLKSEISFLRGEIKKKTI